jgi:uncharacterized repeat protein (TIGR01451 family)
MPTRLLRLLAVLLFAATPLSAATFTLVASGGSWSNGTIWLQNGVPASRTPGSLVGTTDIVNVIAPLYTVTEDIALAEPVELHMTCGTGPCIVDVTTGTLKLTNTAASDVGNNTHLKINGGTIDNAGTLNFKIGSFFDWSSGTLTGSGNTNIAFDSTTPAILNLVNGTLDGHTLNLNGKAAYTGSFAVNNGAQVNIAVNAVFDIKTTGAITTNNTATSKITNAGTFEKTAGAGGTNVSVPLYNTGIVKAWFNTLVAGAGGTHTGSTFDVATGCSLELDGTFAGTNTLQGLGTVTIVGSPTINSGGILSSNVQTVTMAGGILQGPVAGSAMVDFNSFVNFNGGVWQRNLIVSVVTGATVEFTGAAAATVTGAAVTVNSGALLKATPGVGTLAFNTGTTVTNNGTFRLNGDVNLTSDSGATVSITNNSTFEKTAGSGTATVGVVLNNNNIVTTTAGTGTLTLTQSGTHTASTFTLGSATVLEFFNGTHIMDGASITGSTGQVVIDAALLDIGAGGATIGAPLIENAGGISGAGTLAINAAYSWNGGIQSGTGQTNLGLFTHTLKPSAALQISGRKIINSGTINYSSPGANRLAIDNGGGLANNGVFNINGDFDITSNGGGSLFDNLAGSILNKGSGAGIVRIGAQVNNAGTVNVTNGQLAFNGSGTNSGAINLPGVANMLVFESGAYNFAAGTTTGVNDNGWIKIDGATLTTSTVLSLRNVQLSSGILTGSTLTIPVALKWNGGTILGPGTTNLPNTATVDLSALTAFAFLDNRTVSNDAAVTYDAGAFGLTFANGAVWNNNSGADFNSIGGGAINNGAGTSTFNNLAGATLRKSAGASGTRVDVILNNAGTVSSQLNGQSLIVKGGGGMTGGVMNAAGTALLDFFNATFTVTGGTFTGTGSFRINGGTLAVDTPLTIPSLTISSGALAGSSTATLQGGIWTGGDMNGAGTTNIPAGKTYEIATNTAKFLRRPFTNDGTVVMQNLSVSLTMENGVTFTNNALVEFQSNTTFFCTCAPTPSTFHNAAGATLQQFNAAGTSNFLTLFDNDGTVDLQTGILFILNGGGTHSGTFTVADPTFLSFDGTSDSFAASSSISGSGAVEFSSTTSTFAGSYNVTGVNALLRINGNVSFTGPSTVTTSALQMLTGSIGGTAALTIAGGSSMQNVWEGGTIGGSGAFTNAAISQLDIDGVIGAMTLDGRTLTNDGVLHFTSPSNALTLTNGASIANTGTFELQDNAAITAGPGTNSIVNSGTFKKSVTAGTSSLAPAFTNSSIVNLFIGVTNFNGGFVQTGGNTFLNGGDMGGSSIGISGGGLRGKGNIGGDVTSSATVAPGFSAGAITINGNYTQTGSGTLQIELDGSTIPGVHYDQLAVNGTVTLDGTLDVTFINPYVPSGGETYDVLTFTSKSGDFATKNLPTFPAGGAIQANYLLSGTPQKLQLAAVTTQSDLSVTQTTSGPALHGDDVTFTITVANNGPSTASGVSLGDTFSNGTFVSANSTLGSCTGSGPVTCTIGTLTAGGQAVITLVLNAATVSTMSSTATVTSTTFELAPANDSDTDNVTVSAAADVGVTITDSSDPSTTGNVTYIVTVTNAGPDPAASASVALSIGGGFIVSTTSASFTCSGSSGSATCTAATLATGTHTITVGAIALVPPLAAQSVTAFTTSTMTLSATVSSATADPDNANNSDSESTTVPVGSPLPTTANLSITKNGPSSASSGDVLTYTITVSNSGPSTATNVVVSDPRPARTSFVSNSGACNTPFPCNLGTLLPSQTKVITAKFQVSPDSDGRTITNTATVASDVTDPSPTNNSATMTTNIACDAAGPLPITPANGAVVPNDTPLSWAGHSESYNVYLGEPGSGCNGPLFSSTFGTSLNPSLAPGTAYEWRVEGLGANCPTVSSACVSFRTEDACAATPAPLARVVGQTTTEKSYAVEWDAVPRATRYEIDESTNLSFTGAQTTVVNGLSKTYVHAANAPTAYYYRVRAFDDCQPEAGPYSIVIRVVIVPLPPQGAPQDINVPAGSTELILQQVFIPGEPGESLLFNASTDREWLRVQPSQGVLPPEGVTLQITADPSTLPNGTFTASIILALRPISASNVATNASSSKSVPLSINLVTPISPVPSKEAASQYAMVIPSVGHLDGINSHWQSDIRVTNAGFSSSRYRLTFTPSGGTGAGVKQTIITVDAGATTALDDVIRNWYGIGALGESTLGMLEILALDDPAVTSAATVASSRTYNVAGTGTLGQFIPAIRFNGFIGQALQGALPQLLSIQQIAQTQSYRTNVGVAEGSGAPASVMLRFFNSLGSKVLEVPVNLAAGEQRQLNSLLSVNGITLTDGRVEAQVIGGTGKVTAYASVVDNQSNDPLLVSGTPLTQSGATRWVLPGVANLDNPAAHWRTDMRVFNYGTAAQPATLTFFPLGGGASKEASVTLNAGQILTLDNIVRTLFATENAGGVVHLSTSTPASLVVTGRTYNDTPAGTFGQFIPAVTPDLGAGLGDRALNILQVEDSVRYRTNIGIAEITGKPVTIELQIVLPDSKVTPTVTIPLAANEFRQFAVIKELGLGAVYNGRISIRVVEGQGRVTAYGSVIDETTQDPTYVPAQ